MSAGEPVEIAGASLFDGKGGSMKKQYQQLTSVTALEGVEHCAVLTIENDAKRNSLSFDVIRSLRSRLEQVLSEQPRAIVIAASGSVFSAGHDFRELIEPKSEEVEQLFNECAALIHSIREAPCPIISRVQGAAIGAGCLLALECDFVVASDQATFQTPGGARGWFCFTPMLALLDRTTPKRALEMLIGGEKISADQAYSWGLINRVTAAEQLDSELATFAAKVTTGSAHMIALGKKAFYQLAELPFDQRLAHATELMASTVAHPDAQKRISGFIKS